MDISARADAFAEEAHGRLDQRRRYTGEPYITHPRAVAQKVRAVGGTEGMVAAALLHDVVEDTEVTLSEIRTAFGDEVADMVGWLTDPPPSDGMNRRARVSLAVERLGAAPAEVQTIKLADLIENSASIIEHDPGFASLYLREKKALLAVLVRGESGLRAEAARLLAEGLVVVDRWHAQRARATSPKAG